MQLLNFVQHCEHFRISQMDCLTNEECHNALGLAKNLCATWMHGIQPFSERHKYIRFQHKLFHGSLLTFQINRIVVMKARWWDMAIVRLVCLPKIPWNPGKPMKPMKLRFYGVSWSPWNLVKPLSMGCKFCLASFKVHQKVIIF